MSDTKIKQRDTRQRRMVYEAVMRRKDHPNVDEIYMEVHHRDRHISKATVYRNLKLLAEKGEVLQVRTDGQDIYDSVAQNHYHIVCVNCGRIENAPIPYQEEDDTETEGKTGYHITKHSTVFEGLCPDCMAKLKEERM